jgi:hypothetical protein
MKRKIRRTLMVTNVDPADVATFPKRHQPINLRNPGLSFRPISRVNSSQEKSDMSRLWLPALLFGAAGVVMVLTVRARRRARGPSGNLFRRVLGFPASTDCGGDALCRSCMECLWACWDRRDALQRPDEPPPRLGRWPRLRCWLYEGGPE